jgi:CheY-like chemotaxis protein
MINQMVVQAMLEKAGLQITMASDGKEAIEKATSESFDVILMDIHMPKMNGLDATRALRKKGLTLPILALTASVLKGEVDQCLEAGCNEHLSKPVDRQILFEVLDKYLPSCDKPSGDKIDDDKDREELMMKESIHQNVESIIDWPALKSRIGNEELIKKIVSVFLDKYPEQVERLAQAVREANPEDVRSLAHALKGAAANMGARLLSQEAYQLELAGKQNDSQTFESLFENVQNEFEKIQSFVSQDNWTEIAKCASDVKG